MKVDASDAALSASLGVRRFGQQMGAPFSEGMLLFDFGNSRVDVLLSRDDCIVVTVLRSGDVKGVSLSAFEDGELDDLVVVSIFPDLSIGLLDLKLAFGVFGYDRDFFDGTAVTYAYGD